jgi:hypothetical protein
MFGLESDAKVQTLLIVLFMSAVDVLRFGKGSVQSRHWFGQVLPPVLLEVLRSGHQLGQNIGSVNQVSVVDGFCVSIERGDSVVSCAGSDPFFAVSSTDKQSGQRCDPF